MFTKPVIFKLPVLPPPYVPWSTYPRISSLTDRQKQLGGNFLNSLAMTSNVICICVHPFLSLSSYNRCLFSSLNLLTWMRRLIPPIYLGTILHLIPSLPPYHQFWLRSLIVSSIILPIIKKWQKRLPWD